MEATWGHPFGDAAGRQARVTRCMGVYVHGLWAQAGTCRRVAPICPEADVTAHLALVLFCFPSRHPSLPDLALCFTHWISAP